MMIRLSYLRHKCTNARLCLTKGDVMGPANETFPPALVQGQTKSHTNTVTLLPTQEQRPYNATNFSKFPFRLYTSIEKNYAQKGQDSWFNVPEWAGTICSTTHS